MSNQDKIQKLQAEKTQLKREEKTLRQLVDLVKNQISGLQVFSFIHLKRFNIKRLDKSHTKMKFKNE